MTSPRPLLRAALAAKEWTNARLRDESGLRCTVASISRKLNGLQSITADEAHRMAAVLGVTIPGRSACRALENKLGVSILWPADRRRGAA